MTGNLGSVALSQNLLTGFTTADYAASIVTGRVEFGDVMVEVPGRQMQASVLALPTPPLRSAASP